MKKRSWMLVQFMLLFFAAGEALAAGNLVEPIATIGGGLNVIRVRGNTAYGIEGCSLAIFNVNNPDQPLLVSKLPLESPPVTLDVTSHTAFIVCWKFVHSIELDIVDISDPQHPQLKGKFDFDDSATDFTKIHVSAISDNLVVAAGLSDLSVIDTSNPAAPIRRYKFSANPGAGVFTTEGNRLYLQRNGLEIFDLSDPTSPTLLGKHAQINTEGAIAVKDSLIHIASYSTNPYDHSLLILDAGDPTSLTTRCRHNIPESPNGSIGGVALSGSTALVYGGDIHVMDVSNPGQPRELALVPWPAHVNDDNFLASHGFDGRLACFPSSGYRFLDLTQPSAPVWRGKVDSPFGAALDLSLTGNLACILDDPLITSNTLHVCDISNPAAPVYRGGVKLPQRVNRASFSGNKLATAGSLALISTGSRPDDILVCDLSHPTSPTLIGGYRDPATKTISHSICASGSWAYWTDDRTLSVIDIQTPSAPRLARKIELPGIAFDMVLNDQKLLVYHIGLPQSGILVFNVSAPDEPRLEGVIHPEGIPVLVKGGSGEFVHLATSDFFKVYSLRDPSMPVLFGQTPFQRMDFGVDVTRALTFMTDWTRFWIMDSSHPNSPREITRYSLPETVDCFDARGNLAFVGTDSGVIILRYNGPLSNNAAEPGWGMYD